MVAHWLADPLGIRQTMTLRCRAQGWPSGCLIPCALTVQLDAWTPQWPQIPWALATPLQRRWYILLCAVGISCCVQWRCRGTLGRVGGTLDGLGRTWVPLGGLSLLVCGAVWVFLVIPFPRTADLPLVGSPSYCANSPSGLRETPPT